MTYLCMNVDLLHYARAWQGENGKERGINSLLRAWQMAPYHADRRRQAQEDAARKAGLL